MYGITNPTLSLVLDLELRYGMCWRELCAVPRLQLTSLPYQDLTEDGLGSLKPW